jgi:hypothetical protein
MPWNKYAAEAFDDDDFDRNAEAGEWGGRQPSDPRCKYCGDTEVRWRQQGGKWVLFSLKPGVVHQCPIPDPFDVVPE